MHGFAFGDMRVCARYFVRDAVLCATVDLEYRDSGNLLIRDSSHHVGLGQQHLAHRVRIDLAW
jgi:hypothetical protein